MEILICVKQVPDDSVEIHLNPETKQPDLSSADPQGSAFDTYALEMAARYTEEHEGNITVLSVGPEENKTSLKNCLAVGASKAVLISDEGLAGADPAVIAGAIAAAVPKLEEENGTPFDLILCGRESTDDIGGEVGERLAARMRLPLITDVVEMEQTDAGVRARKELESGYQMIEGPLPAVMTVSKPDYDPRYPTIKNKLAARKIPIPVLQADEIGMESCDKTPKVAYDGFAEVPKRTAGIQIQEEDPEEAVRQALEAMAKDKAL